ncbi:DUF6268 family outer membrane beta-barrel protein [Luteolibacter marinus]|uniref:DUF6268 family outer membrane beta-barrel protein n=1 Tax=Luteolibacter marinus TaxID=2776705 RepID=UPI0018684337|nr:DUF6268 family outer membrane beta-barrel protein [Luteolibacter marinus]
MKKLITLTVAALHPLLLSANEPDPVLPPSEGLDFMSALNAAQVRAIGSFGMDFDNSVGGIDDTTFEAGSFLSKPIDLFAGYDFLAYFNYEAHFLRPDGTLPGIPLQDEDLHEIDLSMFIYKMTQDSPWITGAWINPSLATDFDSVSGDDFFLDVAGFAGYRFSETFLFGAGVGALNVTGDTAVYPGFGFVWNPCDEILAVLYGANFRVGWEPVSSWRLGFEVRPNGGIWNIDTAAGSRNIDFTSFRVGLTSSHRLTDRLWFSYGGGVTTGNTLNITNTRGSNLYQNQLDDLDSGYYGFLALDLKAW